MEPDKATIDQMTRYLLHEAPEAERDAAEQSFFEDDELFYSMLELESDLTDEYAAGRLGPNQRERFESSVAAIPSKQQKVAIAIALREVISHETSVQDAPPQPASRWQRFVNSLLAHKQLVGLSAVSLVLVIGIGLAFVSISVLSMFRAGTTNPDVYSNSQIANTAPAPPAYYEPRVELRPNTPKTRVALKFHPGKDSSQINLVVPTGEGKSSFKVVLDSSQDLVIENSLKYNYGVTEVIVAIPTSRITEKPQKITVTVDGGSKFEYHFRFES
ncbi:MAG: hypothetical protein WBO10_04360 [Pyrinomonadaceae bacterium]